MQSPLITDAYPLHKAVALFDLPGVKAALAKGANPNQAVPPPEAGGVAAPEGVWRLQGTYTPMRVAFESKGRYGGDTFYMPEVLTDIIIQLLCAGGLGCQDVACASTAHINCHSQRSSDLAAAPYRCKAQRASHPAGPTAVNHAL